MLWGKRTPPEPAPNQVITPTIPVEVPWGRIEHLESQYNFLLERQSQYIERLESLERQLKEIRLEWEATYDKVIHAVRRTRKREADQASGGDAEPQVPQQSVSRPFLRRQPGGL